MALCSATSASTLTDILFHKLVSTLQSTWPNFLRYKSYKTNHMQTNMYINIRIKCTQEKKNIYSCIKNLKGDTTKKLLTIITVITPISETMNAENQNARPPYI